MENAMQYALRSPGRAAARQVANNQYSVQSKEYGYRNLPCNIQPDELLWAVRGIDALGGGAGVLEWCYDKDDAVAMKAKMERYPQFTKLAAVKYTSFSGR